MAAYIPTFRPETLHTGVGVDVIFAVREGRKTVSYWYAGEMTELKHDNARVSAFIKFNDGSEDWHELNPEFYNAPEGIEPGRVIWPLYTGVPEWEKEECFPSTKPMQVDEAGPSGFSVAKRKATERDITKLVEEAVTEAMVPFVLRIDDLETSITELKLKMEEGVAGIQRPRLTGIFTHDDLTDYNRLSVAEKGKYYGDGRWQGVSDPFHEVKMCASYKLIDAEYACVSKEYDTDSRKYVSDGAAFASWAWYANEYIIKMTPRAAIGFLKDRSVCRSCAIQCFHGTSTLHAIGERGKLCGICKDKMVSFKAQEGVMPVCTDCTRLMNSEGNRERIVIKALGMISYRFDGTGITLRIRESNNGRIPDFVMVGTYSNPMVTKGKFFIVIERDQNQHSGYDRVDDKAKMVTQVAPFLRAETSRVFVIRYCPDGKWKDADGTDVGADIGEEARLVMVRNWVIWYISSLFSMNLKRLTTLYMFFDLDNRENLFEVGAESFGMTDKAPKGVVSEHQYSVEFSEVEKIIYAKAQRYVAVENVFRNITWSQTDRLSKELRDAMTG
jgi:hypothetical protein